MKPCPWCGQKDISLESYKENDDNGYIWFAYAECGICNAQGPITGDKDRLEAMAKAESQWNQRQPTRE